MKIRRVVFFTALCLLLLGLPAKAQFYDFTLIADTSAGSFSGFLASPSINNGGTVAFSAALRPSGSGVFTGSGGPVTAVADTSPGSPFTGFSRSAINDAGTVAFLASLPQGREIFTAGGGSITTITQISQDPGRVYVGLDINNAGTVAFAIDVGRSGWAVLTGSGGPLTLITTGATAGPSINEAGAVAYAGRSPSRPFGPGIFNYNDGSVTTIADDRPGSPFGGGDVSAFRSPSINNAGTVAFVVNLTGGGSGVFTGNGGPLATIADISPGSPFTGFSSSAINDAGTVAFWADLRGGGSGLFTGADPVADKVIATGDPLFGSTVTGLLFSEQGLNNNDQFAFRASLADGRQVIARADVIPEPGTLALLGTGALTLLGCGWRRRRRAA